MAGSTTAGDMTRGNPTRLLIQFAIPMMIGGIFQLMYNMVDTIVLGRFVGAGALASIGATQLYNRMFSFSVDRNDRRYLDCCLPADRRGRS